MVVAVVEEPNVEWRYLEVDALAETGSDGEYDERIPSTAGFQLRVHIAGCPPSSISVGAAPEPVAASA